MSFMFVRNILLFISDFSKSETNLKTYQLYNYFADSLNVNLKNLALYFLYLSYLLDVWNDVSLDDYAQYIHLKWEANYSSNICIYFFWCPEKITM